MAAPLSAMNRTTRGSAFSGRAHGVDREASLPKWRIGCEMLGKVLEGEAANARKRFSEALFRLARGLDRRMM